MGGDRGLEARIPARLTPAEGRRFGFTLAGAFTAVAAILWWKEHATAAQVVAGVAAAFAMGGTFAPTALSPVFRTWMRFGLALSRVTTPIILGIVYFLVITPTGFVLRLLGRGPLTHRAVSGSYWKAPRSGGRSDLTHQF